MTRWRSLLFVPGDDPRKLAKAAQSGADAVIIDLEDAVPPDRKAIARQGVVQAAQTLRSAGPEVVVRINAGWLDMFADLDAAVSEAVSAIMVPKLETTAQLEAVAGILREYEARQGMTAGATEFIALLESPMGVIASSAIAASGAVIGLALGSEDFALALGVAPSPEALDYPSRRIALAAAARGIMALAAPISIAEFRNLEAYSNALEIGRAWGVTGALCIHPDQVAVANAVFQPSEQDMHHALAVLAAWEAAQAAGQAVASLNGRMIDKPVIERAIRLRDHLI